jgi:serine protease Do
VERAVGPAAKAGIQPGDIVLAINGHSVGAVDELKERAEKAGKHVALLVQRGNMRLFVPVEVG